PLRVRLAQRRFRKLLLSHVRCTSEVANVANRERGSNRNSAEGTNVRPPGGDRTLAVLGIQSMVVDMGCLNRWSSRSCAYGWSIRELSMKTAARS
ncbi:MAG: hypothetical protein K0R38_7903, partial [Polyangiaceae bacterium]|nr:hypothetical protein [Polyangiaceae bacterium]